MTSNATELTKIVNLLTKLKPLTSSPGNLRSGTVKLFADPSWSSTEFEIVKDDTDAGERARVIGSLADRATWVAWNLPLGVVMTLTDHYAPLDSDNFGDLKGLGGCVDLVGTGQTETTDLRDCNTNDAMYGYFWRNVDLRYGAVEMFADPNFTGIRQTLFLSEWTPDKIYNLPGSYMNDNMSSIRWRSLKDGQKVTFFEHPGYGATFTMARGSGSTKEVANLNDKGFNDCVSAFRWTPAVVRREKVEPIVFKAPLNNVTASMGSIRKHKNESNLEQKFTITWEQVSTRALSVITNQTHSTGASASVSVTAGGDIGVVKAEATVTVGVEFNYEKSVTEDKSKTTQTGVTYTEEVIAAPRGITEATVLVQLTEVGEKTYETKAVRWYAEQVEGSELDTSNNEGLYKRNEIARVTIAGGIASEVVSNVKFTPL